MSLFRNIHQFFGGRPKVFVMDDSKAIARVLRAVNSTNLKADGFTDCEKLLYRLHSHKNCGYKIGMIHENGSKYKPQALAKFISEIDPSIKLLIYKNESELKQSLLTYSI